MTTVLNAALIAFQILNAQTSEIPLAPDSIVLVPAARTADCAVNSSPTTMQIGVAVRSSAAIPPTYPVLLNSLEVRHSLQDTVRRKRAIEYSDGYFVRAKIHKIGSYTMLPLFAAQYTLGERLLDNDDAPGWMSSAHSAVAAGIGALFVVNTVTGTWNLWDSRKDPAGRTRRIIHSVLLTAADAGFVWTASLAEDSDDGGPNANHRHRDVALGSIALSTVGTVMMWLWK